ncbi:MAG: hypothetical protein VYD64_04710 [Pseudomonadota bacterium]|nr:hypothetical protein [Pseudomonadota bacterium]
MTAHTQSSSLKTVLLIVAALAIGAGGMYIYNEQSKETFSLELPGGGEINVEKDG